MLSQALVICALSPFMAAVATDPLSALRWGPMGPSRTGLSNRSWLVPGSCAKQRFGSQTSTDLRQFLVSAFH
jgi:hypothetical protein